jgi:hypothetical protein
MERINRKIRQKSADATQVKPWTLEERNRVSAKLDREAEFMARRVHAAHVAVIAFFQNGEYMHCLEAGDPPTSFEQLHKDCLTAHAVLRESGGKDVALS